MKQVEATAETVDVGLQLNIGGEAQPYRMKLLRVVPRGEVGERLASRWIVKEIGPV